ANHNLAVLYDFDLQTKLATLAQEIQTADQSVAQSTALMNSTNNPDQRAKYIAERDKAVATLRAKNEQRAKMIENYNAVANNPGYFWVNAPKFNLAQATGHTPQWTVLD